MPVYTSWAVDQPGCNPNAHNCAFLNVIVNKNNWETENRGGLEAFACETKPGQIIHSAPKPTEEYHCASEASWKLRFKLNPANNKCYSFSRQHPDGSSNLWQPFDWCSTFCQTYGATQVKIESAEEQSFVVNNIYGGSWLNMKITIPGTPPATWLDGTPMSYMNWNKDQPGTNPDKQCVIMNGTPDEGTPESWGAIGSWGIKECEGNFLPICVRDALSGPVIPDDETPTIPPNENCDVGWHYNTEKGTCYYLHNQNQGWQAGQDYCLSVGGDMVSINSVTDQRTTWEFGTVLTADIGLLKI